VTPAGVSGGDGALVVVETIGRERALHRHAYRWLAAVLGGAAPDEEVLGRFAW
jgi:hypothetical protein